METAEWASSTRAASSPLRAWTWPDPLMCSSPWDAGLLGQFRPGRGRVDDGGQFGRLALRISSM
jgi:hypothetical protein